MKLTLRSLIAFILLSAPPIHAKGPIGSFLTRALDKNEDFVLGYAQTRHNEVKTNVEERAYSAVDQKLNASLPFYI